MTLLASVAPVPSLHQSRSERPDDAAVEVSEENDYNGVCEGIALVMSENMAEIRRREIAMLDTESRELESGAEEFVVLPHMWL